MAQQMQPQPKKRGRDWGFIAFIAGVLLVAIGTRVSFLLWIGLALIALVILGIVARYVKQLYF